MQDVLYWLFDCISQLTSTALSWKIIGDFSLLHLVMGALLLTVVLNLISFGTASVGGTAEYVGGILRFKNRENKIDRERYSQRVTNVSTLRYDSNGKPKVDYRKVYSKRERS